jgi:hypothetical protein
MSKEDIYDEKIYPLMAQILEICQAHHIAMVASFATPSDDDSELFCSSRVPDENQEYPGHLKEISDILVRTIRGEPSRVLMMTTTDKDGKKTMTAILP